MAMDERLLSGLEEGRGENTHSMMSNFYRKRYQHYFLRVRQCRKGSQGGRIIQVSLREGTRSSD